MQLMRLFGIRIGVDVSWFFVLFIAIFFLEGLFDDVVEGNSAYVAAVIGAFLFFGSILLHELGHALAARREGIGVAGIDLFFFGGLMKMSRDTDSPGAEFKVAVAGPLVTLGLAILGAAVGFLAIGDEFTDAVTGDRDTVGVATVMVGAFVQVNLVLLVFNLVPAYPLDGGRIARSIVWKVTGDRGKATRAAAFLGRGFGLILIAYGLTLAIADDNLFSGLWLAILGWLLFQSARAAVAQTAFTERLEGVTVADIMDPEPVTIPAEIPALRAYEEYFLRYYGYDWFAVVDAAGRYVGRARRQPIETVAAGAEAERPVRDFIPFDDEGSVRADTPLEALLGHEPLARLGALMAVDESGRLRGVVTVEQVSRALRARLAPQG